MSNGYPDGWFTLVGERGCEALAFNCSKCGAGAVFVERGGVPTVYCCGQHKRYTPRPEQPKGFFAELLSVPAEQLPRVRLKPLPSF